MPLDLHVLGLSLAFILSQDQTLRCCIFFFLFFLCCRDARDCYPRGGPTPGTATPKFIALFPGVQRIVTWTRLRFLSLSLTVSFVCRNHFNDLCPSCANGTVSPGVRTPFFPFAVAKVLQKTYSLQTFSNLFFKFFSPKFRNLPSISALHHKIFML